MKQILKVPRFFAICLMLMFSSPFLLANNDVASNLNSDNTVLRSDRIKIERAASIEKKKGLLLFFLNPNGRPRQIQAQILNKNRGDIEKRFQIRSVLTTDQADKMLFYRFGIRRLPSIILLDNSGHIFKQFPPGIQSEQPLLEIINTY